MKVLFIGGTGIISTAISRRVLELGWELYLLNRGNRNTVLEKGVAGKLTEINCDIRSEDEAAVTEKIKKALSGACFDVIADFIAFTPSQIERDYRIIKGLCRQFIFISTATVYQKPLSSYLITESTPLSNSFWQYSGDKIICENFLMDKRRECGFPVTIVRPSHTYDERYIPLGVHGKNGSWQVVKRMLEGKPVIIHGDGTSLWTMTHSSDFARAFTGIMGNIHALGEAVQITSDESVTWNQVYDCIAATLGVELKAVHISSEFLAECGGSFYDFRGTLLGDKAYSVVFDNTKLKRLVPDFCAALRFDEGIKRTIEYVLAHKECQREDPDFDAWCDRVIAARECALRAMSAG